MNPIDLSVLEGMSIEEKLIYLEKLRVQLIQTHNETAPGLSQPELSAWQKRWFFPAMRQQAEEMVKLTTAAGKDARFSAEISTKAQELSAVSDIIKP